MLEAQVRSFYFPLVITYRHSQITGNPLVGQVSQSAQFAVCPSISSHQSGCLTRIRSRSIAHISGTTQRTIWSLLTLLYRRRTRSLVVLRSKLRPLLQPQTNFATRFQLAGATPCMHSRYVPLSRGHYECRETDARLKYKPG